MIKIFDIKKSCKRSLGGIDKVFAILPLHCNIRKNRNVPIAEIEYINNGKAYVIEFDKQSTEYSFEQEYSAAGQYHNHSLSGTISHFRFEMDLFRQVLQNVKVHLLLIMRSGEVYIMPNAKIQTKGTSGKNLKDNSKYSLSFKSQTEFPLPIINSNILPDSVQINISDFVFNTTTGERYRLFVSSTGVVVTQKTTDPVTVNSVLSTEVDSDYSI